MCVCVCVCVCACMCACVRVRVRTFDNSFKMKKVYNQRTRLIKVVRLFSRKYMACNLVMITPNARCVKFQ